ncbi:type II toxin-antitoxin system VapC family toxin [Microbacterium trichothecenolyticum]|uniref:type II toxin-antitoxin system VapC family toxin n=1 Tax=Microbacterium trichothecenolyticum TaxID=69370 RepID=UPI0035BE4C3A
MIYLDACIVIYATEHQGDLGHRARARLAAAASTSFAISPLVIHEVLVGPIRRSDRRLLEVYDARFPDYATVDLDLPAYIRAAELRAAAPGLTTVDALHLAAAQLAGCTELWTNDKRLAAASGTFAVDVINE